MKYPEKLSMFEASGGKYSARKVPQWRMGYHEILEYLDFITHEGEDLHQNAYST